MHRAADGQLVLTLISDDNFSMIQRTLLLQFTLAEPFGWFLDYLASTIMWIVPRGEAKSIVTPTMGKARVHALHDIVRRSKADCAGDATRGRAHRRPARRHDIERFVPPKGRCTSAPIVDEFT